MAMHWIPFFFLKRITRHKDLQFLSINPDLGSKGQKPLSSFSSFFFPLLLQSEIYVSELNTM